MSEAIATDDEARAREVVARFVRTLDVQPAGGDVFIGREERDEEEHDWPRIFGGTVLGQAALAAGRTAPDPTLHSLHAYFLRGGKPDAPIEYRVERVRDGRTFTARRVLARQEGVAICDATMSFVHPEDGIEHQDPAPDIPGPEGLQDVRLAHPQPDGTLWPLGPIEWRTPKWFDGAAAPGEEPVIREWLRFRAPLPDDPVLHQAALVWASDLGSFAGIEVRYGWDGVFEHRGSASLDHAIWIHRRVRWDGWLMMVTRSPVAAAGRAHSLRQFYTRDGVQIATMAQEAVVRRARR
jgi:acyl-CoA thioesterase-2